MRLEREMKMMELEEPLQPIPSRTSHIDGVTARPAHGVLPPAAPLEREREAMEFGECSQSIPPRGSNTDGGAAQPVQGAQDPQHPISYYHGSQEVESAPPEPAVNVEQRQDTEVVQQPNGASNGGFHAEHVTALASSPPLSPGTKAAINEDTARWVKEQQRFQSGPRLFQGSRAQTPPVLATTTPPCTVFYPVDLVIDDESES